MYDIIQANKVDNIYTQATLCIERMCTMATVSTNVKIDPAVKVQAQELFERLGMNLSTAVNIFLRQAIREQAIPFTIKDTSQTLPMPYLPLAKTDMTAKEFNAMIEKSLDDVKNGRITPLHNAFSELRKGLKKV